MEGHIMSSLETTILGITFPNPFILASGPPTANANRVIEAFKAGWGGAVLETIGFAPVKPFNSKAHVIRSGRTKWGMVDVPAASDMTLDQWEDEIDQIRASFPSRPLIVSIMADDTPSRWQELVYRLEKHQINAFEINGNGPSFAVNDKQADELGQDSQALALAVSWVREVTELPVIVKLTPNVTDIVPLARAAVEAGADGFAATGSLSGIGGIDFDTFSTLPAVNGIHLTGSYSGPGLRPVALRWTAFIAKALPTPILGCGGVSSWQDAVEYFAVGASAVQVGTAVKWEGVHIIDQLKEGLEEYLERRGYRTPADLRGKALPNIVGFDELDLDFKLVATLDEAQCIDCDLCVRACNDGGFQAITMVDKIAKVDSKKCDGCGLCIYVCPPDIMNMVPMNQVSANYQGDNAKGKE